MKKWLISLLLFCSTISVYSQNFFEPTPIQASIELNGNQQRIVCTVFDSTLQITKTLTTPWVTGYYYLTSMVPGKVSFTSWNSANQELPFMGIIIYDFVIHDFNPLYITGNPGTDRYENIVAGPKWDVRMNETDFGNNYYYQDIYLYQYNIILHQWFSGQYSPDLGTYSSVWNIGDSGYGFVEYYINHLDEGDFFYLDPLIGMYWFFSGCAGWGTQISDDYLAIDTGCLDNYILSTYDPELHYFADFPRQYLLGGHVNGFFTASDQTVQAPNYSFTYDAAIHQYLSDSILDITNLSSKIIKDRVVAYINQNGSATKKIFMIAHNPITHTLVKDSADITGTATGLTIQNGTVKWTDGNGLNIRGYDINNGWGIYNTPLYLYFHLTDFTSQGFPMVHVRNYSIGTSKVTFDFGDGVTSLNYTQSLWHYYKSPGTYDICIYDSSGTFSSCQTVTIPGSTYVGLATSSADTICQGDTIQLQTSSYSGNLQWQELIGNVWTDLSGPGANDSIISLAPAASSKYRLTATGSGLLPAISNTIDVFVLQPIVPVTIVDSIISICPGQSQIITVTPGTAQNYLWQSNDGSIWTSASGTNNTSNYTASPTTTTEYRVISSNGICFSDTSSIITIVVDPKPIPPSTTGNTICGPGVVTLNATASGYVYWYLNNSLDSIIGSGNSFSYNINSNTTFYVVNSNAQEINAGPTDTISGYEFADNSANRGIRFYSAYPGTLESARFYPLATGNYQINLKEVATYSNNQYKTVSVTNPSTNVFAKLNFKLKGNKYYDLRFTNSNHPSLALNGGISYPINSPDSSITIVGYTDNGILNTVNDYYNFYDLKFLPRCISNLSTVLGTVQPLFNTASILAGGPTNICAGDSTNLIASPTGNYNYKWLKNEALISGITTNHYYATTSGNYKVVMTTGVCSDTSNAKRVQIVCTPIPDPIEKNVSDPTNEWDVKLWEDVTTGQIHLHANTNTIGSFALTVSDISGRVIYSRNYILNDTVVDDIIHLNKFPAGVYFVKFGNDKKVVSTKFVK